MISTRLQNEQVRFDEENFQMMAHSILAALWEELRYEGLIPAEAPTPA